MLCSGGKSENGYLHFCGTLTVRKENTEYIFQKFKLLNRAFTQRLHSEWNESIQYTAK